MVSSRFFLIPLLVSSFSFFTYSLEYNPTQHLPINPDEYQKIAHNWVSTHIANSAEGLKINKDQALLLLNMVYAGFARSRATLEAQEIAYQALEVVWKGWQNIAQSRRNPGLPPAYSLCLKKQRSLLNSFVDAQKVHRTSGSSYNHALNYLVEHNPSPSYVLYKPINELRDQARLIIVDAFLDIKKQLGDFFALLVESATKSGELEDEINQASQDVKRLFGIENLVESITPFAVQSFVQADKSYKKVSESSWQIVSSIQEASIVLWRAIEKARGAYFLALYKECYTALAQAGISEQELIATFDDQGFIRAEDRTTLLPHPNAIVL